MGESAQVCDKNRIEGKLFFLTEATLNEMKQILAKVQDSTFASPVLIIRGDDDWIVSQDLVEETKSRLVNAKKSRF